MYMHESQKFKYALLRGLERQEPDEWVPLRAIMEISVPMAVYDYHMRDDLALSTLKRIRKECQYQGLLEVQQEQGKRSWQIRATEKGRTLAQTLPESYDLRRKTSATKAPSPPYRVEKGHLLPSKVWKTVSDQVQNGEVALIVLPIKQGTKIKFWDEA